MAAKPREEARRIKSITINGSLDDRLKERAAQENRADSNFIETAIKQYLDGPATAPAPAPKTPLWVLEQERNQKFHSLYLDRNPANYPEVPPLTAEQRREYENRVAALDVEIAKAQAVEAAERRAMDGRDRARQIERARERLEAATREYEPLKAMPVPQNIAELVALLERFKTSESEFQKAKSAIEYLNSRR